MNGKPRKRKRGKESSKEKKSMPLDIKKTLAESDKGSYFNQEKYFYSEKSDSSEDETNNLTSVSFQKLCNVSEDFDSDITLSNNSDSDDSFDIEWNKTQDESESEYENDQSSDEECENASLEGRQIIHMETLQNALSNAALCQECKTGTLAIENLEEGRRGLCSKMQLKCENFKCNFKVEFYSDANTGKGAGHYKDVNRLSVLAMRSIGKSRNALLKICSILDLPAPINYKPFSKHTEKLKDIAKETCSDLMLEAANSLKKLKKDSGEWNGEGPCNCAVSIDGSWAHVGYSARNGFVSVISIDTGKVLDYITLSNECKGCKRWEREGKTHTREFLDWFVEHDKVCTMNHEGSAKTMEAQGAVILFQRSEERNGLRYTTFVGDGDSAAYGNVVDCQPYGPNIIIKKEDCVGHIQGRMGKHLKKLVDQHKGKKLADGKQITGKGRLTNKLMNSFQVFYGMAIRNNKGNAPAMQQNVMAILYHYSSTRDVSQHQFCPEGELSWCKWQVDKATGSNKYRPLKNPLSEVLVELLKPVFEKLSSLQLLQGAEKCLTQNQNESLHHVIWSYLPKGEYHSPSETELGVALAVGHFNDGFMTFNSKLFIKSNLAIGQNSREIWERMDSTRIKYAEHKSSETAKQRRKKLKSLEASKLDSLQYDDSYAKEKYYMQGQSSSSNANTSKLQRKCKKCGNPMKGHKRGICN